MYSPFTLEALNVTTYYILYGQANTAWVGDESMVVFGNQMSKLKSN